MLMNVGQRTTHCGYYFVYICVLFSVITSHACAGNDEWSFVGPIEYEQVKTIAIDPTDTSVMYIGFIWGNRKGVFKSTTSGGSWCAVNTGLPSWRNINDLVLDPTDTSVIYAVSEYTIYKSVDAGSSWEYKGAGIGVFDIFVLDIDPLQTATLYAGTDQGVYKTTNGGNAWYAVNNGMPPSYFSVYALAVDPTDSSTVYAGTESGIYKSVNGGGLWAKLTSGISNPQVVTITLDPMDHTDIYIGTDDGVYYSSNSGDDWSPRSTGLPVDNEVNAVVVDALNPSLLYACLAACSS
jgi:hypothetical protein